MGVLVCEVALAAFVVVRDHAVGLVVRRCRMRGDWALRGVRGMRELDFRGKNGG